MTDENNYDAVNAVELATELTIAWLGNPNTRTDAEHVPAFLNSMHSALQQLAGGTQTAASEAEAPQDYTPAVSVRKSLASKDHIISMIDGKPYKTLRRHLATNGLTPEEYRERYNLKADYPMVSRPIRRAVALWPRRSASAASPARRPHPLRPRRMPAPPRTPRRHICRANDAHRRAGVVGPAIAAC